MILKNDNALFSCLSPCLPLIFFHFNLQNKNPLVFVKFCSFFLVLMSSFVIFLQLNDAMGINDDVTGEIDMTYTADGVARVITLGKTTQINVS